MPGGGLGHPAAGQGGWPGSLPGSPGCWACRLRSRCLAAGSYEGSVGYERCRVPTMLIQGLRQTLRGQRA